MRWQALDLLERLPPTLEQARVHYQVILSLVQLPGWIRDEKAEVRLLSHVEQALTAATEAGLLARKGVEAAQEARRGRDKEDRLRAARER